MGIKKALIAPNDRLLMEADYAQLEIRVLAIATGDSQLINDIQQGLDLHSVFASKLFNKAVSHVTPQERKIAKGFSFQLQYGAGAASMAKKWNVDIRLAKKFIKEYYTRYPDVKRWQDANIDYMQREGIYDGATYDDNGRSVGVKSWVLPSIWPNSHWGGFKLHEEPSWGGQPSFSPTKIKNYPIQGAAADIMLLMLSELRRGFLAKGDVIGYVSFINTVHDSFILAVDSEQVDDIAEKLKSFLESVPEVIHRVHGVVSPVEFPVDITVGPNWEEQNKFDL